MTAADAAFARTRPAAKAMTPWSVPTLAVALFATGFGVPRAGGFTAADALIGAFIVLATLEMVARRARPRPIISGATAMASATTTRGPRRHGACPHPVMLARRATASASDVACS